MTIYRCKTTFGSFQFAADFAQASSNICIVPDRGDNECEGGSTPFQVADAGHDPDAAAQLLLKYFGRDYWCDPSDVSDGYAVTYVVNRRPETKVFESDEEEEAEKFAAEHGAEVEEIETFAGQMKDQYISSLIVSVEALHEEQD